MNCSQIKLENFTGKVNQCLTPAIYPYGSKGRNPPKMGEGETKPSTHERSACVPKSFHQAGEKVVASFSQTVAFYQVICKRSQNPALNSSFVLAS